MKIFGKLIDVHLRQIYSCKISVKKGRIEAIEKTDREEEYYILPGLIDAHIHIESSMLTPGNFAKACVPHGTIAVVSDPHEIANVLGIKGIEYMLNDSEKVPVIFNFGLPSCVPATAFETSGGRIGLAESRKLLKNRRIKYLAEMMNYPGVINEDKETIAKLFAAKKEGKKIDGHAPGLTGQGLKKYINAGISTDHECVRIDEAKEKLSYGMKILIREGSAARNLNELKDLYKSNPEEIMLCSDDLHPEMLERQHINKLIANLIKEGYDKFDVIRSATINPLKHYSINIGMLREGDRADFIIIDRPDTMNVYETWIGGQKVFDRGKVLFDYHPGSTANIFNCSEISKNDIIVENQSVKFRIIGASDGELLTEEIIHEPIPGKILNAMPERDILKIIVKDRYKDGSPAIGYITGFKLKEGAFASSVAHDSHNIIAIGTNDKDIITATNEIIRMKGGLAAVNGGKINSLQLDVAGIMSRKECHQVATEYKKLTDIVKKMGCEMRSPFMSLSFMALLVIPELKLSDKGLFNGEKFSFVPLFVDQ